MLWPERIDSFRVSHLEYHRCIAHLMPHTLVALFLAEALREAQGANKDLNRQVAELTALRVALEGERDSLAADLADTKDAYKDAQARLDAANNALSQLRSEMEHRLREKDEELENIRWVLALCACILFMTI